MPKRSSDDLDNDHTDELPVLLETVVLGDDSVFPGKGAEDTSEHAALYQAAEQPSAGISALHAELAQHAAQTAGLEAELATLANRARDLERRLSERDRQVSELEQTVAALRESVADTSSAERRLATQLAVRDARIAEAAATVEQLEREAAARVGEIDRLRTAAETALREADTAKRDLAARPESSGPPQDVQTLLEDNAALKDYIAGRQAWWIETQAKQASLAGQLTSLRHELAASKKELAAAEAFAARESSRAVGLRAELVDYARRAADLERDLRAARLPTEYAARAAVPAVPAAPVQQPAAAPPPPLPAATTSAPAEPPITADVGADIPAVEAIAQLEAEVGYKRQQVAAQLVELRDRDQRLLAAAADLERSRRELSMLRNELEESRATVARLERAVIDKDRALEARDARIGTLQEEIKQRLGAIEKLNAIDLSPPKVDAPATPRAAAIDSGGDSVSAPALLCLTGDAPKRFALTKKTVTVGRGPHCDLQILTHFVSREHARITLSAGAVLIEDLGSRNGVYVNAVRVDRQALQQGDLVTIGETQFRFMESMAH